VRERLGKRGISDVELKFGATGQFDVFIDDRLAFSKATEGRFPTDEQSFSMDERALAELLTTDDKIEPAQPKPRAAHPSIPALP